MSLWAVQREYAALAGRYDQRWAGYVAASTALAAARVVFLRSREPSARSGAEPEQTAVRTSQPHTAYLAKRRRRDTRAIPARPSASKVEVEGSGTTLSAAETLTFRPPRLSQ